jgi:hypothetical protein
MARKPTIDGDDDVDDEDGIHERERRRRSDLRPLSVTRDPGFGVGDEGYLNDGRDDGDPNPKREREERERR